jgi:hypothetical protein
MGSIYWGAWNVVVWLGPARDNSDLVMSVLTVMISQLGLSWKWSGAQYSAIVALCTRPYWRRAWVQQEIHLAHQYSVYCGKSAHLPSSTFADSLYKVVNHSNTRLAHRNKKDSGPIIGLSIIETNVT